MSGKPAGSQVKSKSQNQKPRSKPAAGNAATTATSTSAGGTAPRTDVGSSKRPQGAPKQPSDAEIRSRPLQVQQGTLGQLRTWLEKFCFQLNVLSGAYVLDNWEVALIGIVSVALLITVCYSAVKQLSHGYLAMKGQLENFVSTYAS